MGRPKLLLVWQGETLIRRAARIALEAGLAPVVVVTGAGADEIQSANPIREQIYYCSKDEIIVWLSDSTPVRSLKLELRSQGLTSC
jgi:CTP:molybdopterin cytidylyltransferase MocA